MFKYLFWKLELHGGEKTRIKMRVLITGASGLLGKRIFDIISKNHQTVGTYNKNSNGMLHYLDIVDRNSVELFFRKFQPEIVIHCAAMVNPDYCEENQELSKMINIDGTRNIVDQCKIHSTKMIFLSSDFVFEGNNGPYFEDSELHSNNYYGVTKIEGEKIVRENLEDYLIIRPALMYGNDENTKLSFVTDIFNKLLNNEKIFVDNKIMKYPTLTDDVVEVINELIDLELSGTYHVCGEEGVTKYAWAKRVAKFYGFSEENIFEKESSTEIVKRPLDVKLDSTKIKRFIMGITGIDEGIKKMNNQKGCSFRLIYSARPDKLISGQNVSTFRINLGKELAVESPVEADLVMPVPETGIYPATGYADQSKIPFYFGVIRDYFTDKTLFSPTLKMRNASLDKKLIIVPEIISGKRIILVDEAIVSGTTLHIIIEKLKNAGAKEIHVRIPSPPISYSCQYNILEKDAKLLANKHGYDKSAIEDGLTRHFDVNSLKFLSLKGFLKYLDHDKRPCYECFSKQKHGSLVNIGGNNENNSN